MKLKIGDFLKRCKDAIDVSDGVKYKRAKIRINHKGISVRDELDGFQIKTKRQFLIQKGQFLLSKIDARNGAFGIVPEELDNAIITGNFWTFNVDESMVLKDFFKAFTETISFVDICLRASSGTTNRKYLDEKKFLDIDIKVPDLSIQKIAVKIYHERKFTIEGLVENGIGQRFNLSNLRQAILQEAVQGKLTLKWREASPSVDNASTLLKRIEAEKQKLIAEKKIKKEKPLSPIEDEDKPYDLPEGWAWCRIAELGIVNPRNNLDDNLDIGFISMKSISKNYSIKPVHEVRKWKDVKKSFTHFKNEDVAFAKITPCFENSKACVFKELPNGSGAGTTELHVFRRITADIHPYFIYSVFKSPIFLKEGEGKMTGSAGQKRVPKNYFAEYVIGLPSTQEQQAIVEKINSLMALCDDLEQQVDNSQTQIEQLMQSCLKEVFDTCV
jgi:type I restriction enzyme, S subunit